MQDTEIDERVIANEQTGADFVVFVYEGGDAPGQSWSVASYLLGDASLPEVAGWLRETVPPDACYSVGVVLGGPGDAADTDPQVAWVLGADVLNADPADRTDAEQRTADEMLARRGRVDLE